MPINTKPIITVAILSMALSQTAIAQSFEHTLDSKASSANLDSSIIFDSSGTIIGDHDAKANPNGTQTRTGLFGGSGNNPIDTSVSLQSETLLDTQPTGSFASSIDFKLGLIEIDGLMIDMLAGDAGSTTLSATLLYNSFHTINPTFLYPGGIPFTIPFGEIGGINEAILTQTDQGLGTITSTEIPNFYEFSALIPAQLDLAISASLPGQDPGDTPIDALPIVLPATGTIQVLGDGSIMMTINLAPEPIVLEIPIEDATLPEVPFQLPTFGAETASVIYTPTPEMISINATLGLTISSAGTQASCAADLTGDGELNFFDVSAFLSAFAAMEPVADFNDDGKFNFFDVSDFLGAFAQGCPE